ncbi:hypothetical protein WN944_029003 [Citrus x changshan-huyou]|uniref:Uncharacterized protein n=1 Tax=Citrus x changshan-huyou TaxID=2935761 RepID=A0AAP0LRS2_9ROSI
MFSVNNLAGAWWAVQEAARYCIAMRLRTNLGGPTQTFAALERMLLDIADVLQLDSDQIDGNLSIIGSSGTHLRPMRLLLDFVEALKKNVYNAYEGSAILPPANRHSSMFFGANKKVCEEWFSRICDPMINAGLALQCHDTIQYCTSCLQELRNLLSSALKDKSRAQVSENLHNIRGRYSGDLLKKSLEVWLLELQTLRAKHAGKNYYSALTAGRNEINAIHALARFDEGDFQAAWAFLDLTPKSSCELTLDPKLALQRSDQMLLQALLLLNEGKSVINSAHQDCNPWLKVLRVYRAIAPSSPVTFKLCMNLSSLARKQRNMMIANRLNNYLRDHISSCSDERCHKVLISNLKYEEILLMYAENKYEDAFTNLWSFVHL